MDFKTEKNIAIEEIEVDQKIHAKLLGILNTPDYFTGKFDSELGTVRIIMFKGKDINFEECYKLKGNNCELTFLGGYNVLLGVSYPSFSIKWL